MPYSVQNAREEARKNAFENLELFKDYPPLLPNSKQRCLEFFYDDPDVPRYVLLDGKLIINPEVTKELGTFQLFGDGGALAIEVDGDVIFSRVKNWQAPEILSASTEDALKLLEDAIKLLNE